MKSKSLQLMLPTDLKNETHYPNAERSNPAPKI